MPQRFAYLVLAHEEPMLALRLLTRVRTLSPTAAITLRHDQPGGYLTDAQIRAAGAEPFRSEIATAWGEWSLVEATVELLAHARATTDADWLVLISARDYPVRDLQAWERVVRRLHVGALLNTGPETAPPLPGGLAWRGSQFWAMSAAMVDDVLQQHRARPEIAAYLRPRAIPDESYPQTLAALTSHPIAQGRVSWSWFRGVDPHPAPLTTETVLHARTAGIPFVRKVGPGDGLLMEWIDAAIPKLG